MNKFKIANFAGGVKDSIDISLLKNNEASNARNVNIDTGIFKTCDGIEKFTQATLTNIKTLISYYKSNNPSIVAASNGKLYKLENNTFVEIGAGFSNNNWDYVNNNVQNEDVIILCNGQDNVKVWNGTTLRDLKKDGFTSADSNDNKAPKGKFCELHYERLWLADDNNLYVSKDFDMDDFTTPTDPEQVNQHGAQISAYSNDGSRIIGLKVIFDDVVIFKEKTIFKIFGATPENYQKAQVFNSNGAIADKTIVNTNKGAFFINRDGIWVYDGTNCNLVSSEISNIFTQLNQDALVDSVAYFYKNKYILAVPKGASTSNNFIIEYDLINKTFMYKEGFTVNRFVDYGSKLLFSNDKGIYTYDTGLKFDTDNINSLWETAYNDLDNPNAIKEIGEIYFTGSGNGQVKISCITEKKEKSKIVSLIESEKVYRVNINNKGRLVKFKIENVDGSKIALKGFTAFLELDED